MATIRFSGIAPEEEDGSGELHFEQLAYPSGGIEATEYLIVLFDGLIEANDAI